MLDDLLNASLAPLPLQQSAHPKDRKTSYQTLWHVHSVSSATEQVVGSVMTDVMIPSYMSLCSCHVTHCLMPLLCVLLLCSHILHIVLHLPGEPQQLPLHRWNRWNSWYQDAKSVSLSCCVK